MSQSVNITYQTIESPGGFPNRFVYTLSAKLGSFTSGPVESSSGGIGIISNTYNQYPESVVINITSGTFENGDTIYQPSQSTPIGTATLNDKGISIASGGIVAGAAPIEQPGFVIPTTVFEPFATKLGITGLVGAFNVSESIIGPTGTGNIVRIDPTTLWINITSGSFAISDSILGSISGANATVSTVTPTTYSGPPAALVGDYTVEFDLATNFSSLVAANSQNSTLIGLGIFYDTEDLSHTIDLLAAHWLMYMKDFPLKTSFHITNATKIDAMSVIGTFIPGETLTGPSGTATVLWFEPDVVPGTGRLWITVQSGTFSAGNSISSPSGNATANIVSVPNWYAWPGNNVTNATLSQTYDINAFYQFDWSPYGTAMPRGILQIKELTASWAPGNFVYQNSSGAGAILGAAYTPSEGSTLIGNSTIGLQRIYVEGTPTFGWGNTLYRSLVTTGGTYNAGILTVTVPDGNLPNWIIGNTVELLGCNPVQYDGVYTIANLPGWNIVELQWTAPAPFPTSFTGGWIRDGVGYKINGWSNAFPYYVDINPTTDNFYNSPGFRVTDDQFNPLTPSEAKLITGAADEVRSNAYTQYTSNYNSYDLYDLDITYTGTELFTEYTEFETTTPLPPAAGSSWGRILSVFGNKLQVAVYNGVAPSGDIKNIWVPSMSAIVNSATPSSNIVSFSENCRISRTGSVMKIEKLNGIVWETLAEANVDISKPHIPVVISVSGSYGSVSLPFALMPAPHVSNVSNIKINGIDVGI